MSGPIEFVRAKGVEIPIYFSPVGGRDYFLVSYYSDGQRKRDRAGKTVEEARAYAKEKIEELAKGTAHVGGTLTPRQLAVVTDVVEVLKPTGVSLSQVAREYAQAYEILGRQPLILKAAQHYADFLEEQKKKSDLIQIKLPALAQKFMEDIRERKKSRRYILDMQARLAQASKAFTGMIADIKADDIDAWLKSMKGLSGRSKNNFRSALCTLFTFAKKKGHLPRGQQTEAEFSARYDDYGGPIGIYSPEQLSLLLTNIEKRFVPFVAIGAFAGLRSVEICRLEWSEVRFEQDVIEIKASKAKTASRRLVPILPALQAWLIPFRQVKGKVLQGILDEFALATQFKRAVDALTDSEGKPLIKLVHNGLRHSFITYRMATEKNAAAVSLEAGNSPRMIFEHYRELATEGQGKAWFSVMPSQEGNVLAFSASSISSKAP